MVHCSELEVATFAVDAALQTIGQLATSSELQNALLKAGVMWYLLPLLLQYDSTAETTVEINKELSGNGPPPVPASPEQNQKTGQEQGEEGERVVLAAAPDVRGRALA